MDKKSIPIWLWPNVLSLDAPLVAVAWVWMLKVAFNIQYIEPNAIWVLFVVVWCIYVLDRIVDVWVGRTNVEESARHRFSWENKWILLPIVLIAMGWCIFQSLYHLPATMLSAGVAGIIMLLLYALMLPLKGSPIPYAKNLAAGMIFAFGVSIPARLYQFNSDVILNNVFYPLFDERAGFGKGVFDALYNMILMTVQHIAVVIGTIEAVMFGLLCMLNITAIDLWENARRSDDEEVKATNELILTLGLFALIGFSLLYAMFWASETEQNFCYAVILAPIPFFYLFTSTT